MYGGLLNDLAGKGKSPQQRTRALTGLAIYHLGLGGIAAMGAAVEGKDPAEAVKIGAAQVPLLYGVYDWIRESTDADYKEWRDENSSAIMKIIQAPTATPGFLGVKIATQKLTKSVGEIKKALEAARDGDTETAGIHAGRALFAGSMFFPTPIGTKLGQGVGDFFFDAAEGEFDPASDGVQQFLGRTTPFYKDQVGK